MLLSVDIETQGLDATKFIFACIKADSWKNAEYFFRKEDLWNRIITLANAQAKRKKMLNVYAHNHNFDFHGYAPLTHPNIHWFCEKPFIVSYKNDVKEICKFLDSWAIFRMSLKAMGKVIGLEKLDMPEELLIEEDQIITNELLEKIKPYCERDVEIVLQGIQMIKEKAKNDGVAIKRLYTINQIAGNFLVHKMKQQECQHIFQDIAKGKAHPTMRKEEIHNAYRGGRVEAWQSGKFEKVSYLDINSLYPFSACKMRFPDLRSERKIFKPLGIFSEHEIFSKIGISRACMLNMKDRLGVLPIRTKTGNYFPKNKKMIIGTWTHDEIKMALANGYQLLDIEWSVVWEDGHNPFPEIFEALYEKRFKSDSEFDKYYYKQMMNAGIGKLAQHRTGQELVIDSVEKVEEYLKKQYDIIKGIGLNYMYKKDEVKVRRKPYYMPIVPTLINAFARLYMYEQYQKIPLNDLIYTDTDSIIFTGEHEHKFDINNKMGGFKLEYKDVPCNIIGMKTYTIGEDIKIAGIHKAGLNKEDVDSGFVKSKSMISIRSTNDIENAGKFKEVTRDLNQQHENHLASKKIMAEQFLYIDEDIEDIQFFLPRIEEFSQEIGY